MRKHWKSFPKLPFIFSLLAIGLVTFSSCKEDVQPGSNIIFPTKNVSYAGQVEPLFHESCAFSGCHDTETRADGLSLETWFEALSSKSGVILPKDTTNSRLVWSIEGTKPGYPRMPLNLPALTQNQITGLKQWILEGAQNN